nr:immunoglobulin light chain junction region [Macaca mulatta]MPO03372.1 immunoglobulin light chain junction region [Macaca mulatta]MPO04194.1 immunoglobulin light chain junction region [Macaca mulatta]MPO05035.1 immunoglobulin light chain junction region [Macaca mulatta]MPO05584.1 immunoglobulin light chain junction region [Macaca mulatta]
CMIWHNNSYIF